MLSAVLFLIRDSAEAFVYGLNGLTCPSSRPSTPGATHDDNMMATALGDGSKALFCGGRIPTNRFSGRTWCWLYEAATAHWTQLADMTTNRFGAAMVQLSEDKVWIAGNCIIIFKGFRFQFYKRRINTL